MFVPMAAAGWSTEQSKMKIRSVGTNWSFCLQTCCMQSPNHLFFSVCLLNHLLSLILLIPSILEAQLSTVEQQNKDGTARHSVSMRLYLNPSCTIIVSHFPLPTNFKRSVNMINAHWILFHLMRITVWTCLYFLAVTSEPQPYAKEWVCNHHDDYHCIIVSAVLTN